jgi:pilus assembly protein Flp/PilA
MIRAHLIKTIGGLHMGKFSRSILKSSRSERGQDLAEYALLLGLLALVVIVAVTLLGGNLSMVFSSLASQVGTWF